MILTASEDLIFSSLGWADGASIWVFDVQTDEFSRVPVSEARYISLHRGLNDYFAVAHNFEDERFEVSVHRANKTADEVARFSINGDGVRFDGEPEAWKNVPLVYVSYFAFEGVKDYWLCLLNGDFAEPLIMNFSWYDDSYDKGYQGVIGAVQVPHSELVLISVQRDSSPVLFDPYAGKAIRKLNLADRRGNPKLTFSRKLTDLWADDYDTLIKVDPTDWHVKQSSVLQPAESNGTSAFIGEYWLNPDETLCVVPRPFKGDVVALDAATLKVRCECATGREPLQAVCYRITG